MMKIKGKLINMQIEISSETYASYVVVETGQRVLYVKIVRALYGMPILAVLFYKKLRCDLEEIGFSSNPYDIYAANQIV